MKKKKLSFYFTKSVHYPIFEMKFCLHQLDLNVYSNKLAFKNPTIFLAKNWCAIYTVIKLNSHFDISKMVQIFCHQAFLKAGYETIKNFEV